MATGAPKGNKKNKLKRATKKAGAPRKKRAVKKTKVAGIIRKELAGRIRPVLDDSAKAFVIDKVTGRDPDQIDPGDRLSSWGYDPQHIDLLADAIDAEHWHNVSISHLEIQACKTIQDVIDLVAKKMS